MRLYFCIDISEDRTNEASSPGSYGTLPGTRTSFLQLYVRASRSGEARGNGKGNGQSRRPGTPRTARAPAAGEPGSRRAPAAPAFASFPGIRRKTRRQGQGLLLSFLRQRLPKTDPKRFLPTLSNAASLREKSRFGGIPAPLPGKGQDGLPALPSHTADALGAVSTAERKHFTSIRDRTRTEPAAAPAAQLPPPPPHARQGPAPAAPRVSRPRPRLRPAASGNRGPGSAAAAGSARLAGRGGARSGAGSRPVVPLPAAPFSLPSLPFPSRSYLPPCPRRPPSRR